MSKITRLSLHQEIEKEAERIEKEIAQDPNLKSIEFSEEMEKKLFENIKKYQKK